MVFMEDLMATLVRRPGLEAGLKTDRRFSRVRLAWTIVREWWTQYTRWANIRKGIGTDYGVFDRICRG